jgi:hypothetical protein
VSGCSKNFVIASLFDHLVGALLELQKHVEAKRLGGPHVDHPERVSLAPAILDVAPGTLNGAPSSLFGELRRSRIDRWLSSAWRANQRAVAIE